MYESEGKETINLEMTSDIILAHLSVYKPICNIHNHLKRFWKPTPFNLVCPKSFCSRKDIHNIKFKITWMI